MSAPRDLDIYRALVGSRIAEQAIVDLNDKGVLHDHHSGLGHEAIGVGVGFAVRPDDAVQASHRSGMMLAHARGGFPLRDAVLSDIANAYLQFAPIPGRPRVIPIVGLIGSWVPMSVGFAMADRLRGKDTVTVSFFGDGGANEGAVHEAMNLAGARRLPMVFVIENNGFGLSMPASEAPGADALVDRAAGYGMPGIVVDGNDALAVHEAAQRAVDHARRGDGPIVLEARVTRWGAHADGVPELRTASELAQARERDCVRILHEDLIRRGVLDEVQTGAFADECRREVEAAVEEGLAARIHLPPTVLTEADAWNLTYAG